MRGWRHGQLSLCIDVFGDGGFDFGCEFFVGHSGAFLQRRGHQRATLPSAEHRRRPHALLYPRRRRESQRL